jgi:uncharacterized oxidoreductase
MKLSGQTVLITGGASGIGLALAKRFAARGNTVIVCGRDQVKLDAAAAMVPGLKTLRADVADASERVRLAETVCLDFPALSVLVNNAGIQNQPPPMAAPQDWAAHQNELTINLSAPIHLSMLLLPHLLARPDAAVINVTSGLAFVPIARMPVYCTTKAGLHSFTQSLRHQTKGTSVTVVELAPPAVNTDLGGKGLHDFGEPVDAYADAAFAGLEAGTLEIGYKFSEAARRADRAEQDVIFARMNP